MSGVSNAPLYKLHSIKWNQPLLLEKIKPLLAMRTLFKRKDASSFLHTFLNNIFLNGSKYSRMDQEKFFKGCLPQIYLVHS